MGSTQTGLSFSPFVAKLEAFLRMAGLKFKEKEAGPAERALNPKGKVPFLTYNGEVIGDSQLAIRFLLNTYSDLGVAEATDPAIKALGVLVRHTLEDFAFFGIVCERWRLHGGTEPACPPGFLFDSLPEPDRSRAWHRAREARFEQVWGQGFARHSDADRDYLMDEWVQRREGEMGRKGCEQAPDSSTGA